MKELITITVALLLSPEAGNQQKPDTMETEVIVTFEDTIAPILRKNCSPCHYEGGKVFEKHPFDRYETVRGLGKKLGTRLKGENGRLLSLWIENDFPNKRTGERGKP